MYAYGVNQEKMNSFKTQLETTAHEKLSILKDDLILNVHSVELGNRETSNSEQRFTVVVDYKFQYHKEDSFGVLKFSIYHYSLNADKALREIKRRLYKILADRFLDGEFDNLYHRSKLGKVNIFSDILKQQQRVKYLISNMRIHRDGLIHFKNAPQKIISAFGRSTDRASFVGNIKDLRQIFAYYKINAAYEDKDFILVHLQKPMVDMRLAFCKKSRREIVIGNEETTEQAMKRMKLVETMTN